jgi:hypothetical protein
MSGDDPDPDFLEFFAAEFWPLRRVGFLLSGDWDQAEELAQEAMARTWAAWPRVRGRTGPSPATPAPSTAVRTTAPPTTVVPTAGWTTYTDADHNLRLRLPADWVARPRHSEGTVTLAPPAHAGKALARQPPFAVTVTAGGSYYVGEAPEPGMTRGRLPGGQAYLRFETDPAQLQAAPGQPKPAPNVADRPRSASWSIDWGRDCKGIRPYRCGPHGVSVFISAASTALWDRYLAVAEAIVRTAEPVTPTRPSRGDRRLPACRPDQWRLVWTGEQGYVGRQRFFLSGGIQSLGGPPATSGPGWRWRSSGPASASRWTATRPPAWSKATCPGTA